MTEESNVPLIFEASSLLLELISSEMSMSEASTAGVMSSRTYWSLFWTTW